MTFTYRVYYEDDSLYSYGKIKRNSELNRWRQSDGN